MPGPLPPEFHNANHMTREPNVFGRISRLPALRSSTRQLLSVSLESDSATSEFERAFRADPALAAELLQAANSPLYGLRAQVSSIRHALSMLGLERVRSLALTITMTGYWRTCRADEAIRGSWRHSLATAAIAEGLGRADQAQAPMLYTAGLLHDIGRLALLQISPTKYQQVFATEFTSIQEYLALENLLFECGHDDAGAFLGTAWGLPVALCDCIRFHHCDLATHAGQLFELVGIACRLADTLGYPEVRRADVEQEGSALVDLLPARLRTSPDLTLEALRAKVETQLAAFSGRGQGGTN
jgi:HD-like signal output (HDOD) protein